MHIIVYAYEMPFPLGGGGGDVRKNIVILTVVLFPYLPKKWPIHFPLLLWRHPSAVCYSSYEAAHTSRGAYPYLHNPHKSKGIYGPAGLVLYFNPAPLANMLK